MRVIWVMIRGQLRQVGQFVILIGDKTASTVGPDGINYLHPASADLVTSLDAYWAAKKQ
jgi:hypothetical protein